MNYATLTIGIEERTERCALGEGQIVSAGKIEIRLDSSACGGEALEATVGRDFDILLGKLGIVTF